MQRFMLKKEIRKQSVNLFLCFGMSHNQMGELNRKDSLHLMISLFSMSPPLSAESSESLSSFFISDLVRLDRSSFTSVVLADWVGYEELISIHVKIFMYIYFYISIIVLED